MYKRNNRTNRAKDAKKLVGGDESPYEQVKEMYLDLIKAGWTLNNIDNSDFPFLIELMQYSQQKDDDDIVKKYDAMGM